MPDPILQIEDLTVKFTSELGENTAVDKVSFDLERGRVTAVVGESGSGKSVTAFSVLRLIQRPGRIDGGTIRLRPEGAEPIDITALTEASDSMYDLRGGLVSMVFQEPMTALSPVHTVGDQVSEAILTHQEVTEEAALEQSREMLAHVGIPDPARRMNQYPFELSGGLRQRVVIAMALVCRPELLICDEPTTALDVTIQAEILSLIKRLKAEYGMSVMFITHDLGVVAQIADDVVVMHSGRVLETGTVRQILREPLHPYTQGLIAAVPGSGSRGRLTTVQDQLQAGDLDHYPLISVGDGRQVALPADRIPEAWR